MEPITQETYQTAVQKGKVIIDFWAPWCGPCKALLSIMDTLEQEHHDLQFYKVNVDEEPHLAHQFDIRSVPSLLFVLNGEVQHLHVGSLTKQELTEVIAKHLS